MDAADLEPGCVWLVGTGDGSSGGLSVAGWRALQQADFVLFDAGIAPELLHLVPVGAVAETASAAAARRAIELAMTGWRVVRLKAGDPVASPDDIAEARLLAEAGVGFRILPGAASLAAAVATLGTSDRRSPRHHPAAFTMSGMG